MDNVRAIANRPDPPHYVCYLALSDGQRTHNEEGQTGWQWGAHCPFSQYPIPQLIKTKRTKFKTKKIETVRTPELITVPKFTR